MIHMIDIWCIQIDACPAYDCGFDTCCTAVWPRQELNKTYKTKILISETWRMQIYLIVTVDGCKILHQLIGGLSMFVPLSIGFQPSVRWCRISLAHPQYQQTKGCGVFQDFQTVFHFMEHSARFRSIITETWVPLMGNSRGLQKIITKMPLNSDNHTHSWTKPFMVQWISTSQMHWWYLDVHIDTQSFPMCKHISCVFSRQFVCQKQQSDETCFEFLEVSWILPRLGEYS